MRNLLPRRCVHPQQAVAEIEDALSFVGEELGGDLEEAAARVDDDAGLAQDGEWRMVDLPIR